MTPIQKAKEIIESYNTFCLNTVGVSLTADRFLATPQAAALLSGEDWISVEDRLPEAQENFDFSKDVLAYEDESGSIEVDAYWPSGKYWDSDRLITHWQPLPEPPKP